MQVDRLPLRDLTWVLASLLSKECSACLNIGKQGIRLPAGAAAISRSSDVAIRETDHVARRQHVLIDPRAGTLVGTDPGSANGPSIDEYQGRTSPWGTLVESASAALI